jgi:hypothetical protein
MMLPVANLNASAPDVHAATYHMFILPGDGYLEVREFVLLENLGDTYSGDETIDEVGRTVIFSLPVPTQATEVEVMQSYGEIKFNEETGSLEILTPLPPGDNQIIFRYRLENAGSAVFTFPLQTVFFTRELLLLSSTETEVTSGDLNFRGVVQMTDDLFFNQYYRTNVSPGSRREISVKLPVRGSDRIRQGYSAAFHNPSHIRLWNNSPFRRMEPHAFSLAFILIPLSLLALYSRKLWQLKKEEKMQQFLSEDEKIIRNLDTKLQVIEQKLGEYEARHKAGEISESHLRVAKTALEKKKQEVENLLAAYVE